MRKITIGLLCLIGVMSCEVPQSITVKGNPGVYIPLGSPFSRLPDADRLENRINPDRVKEMLNKSDTNDTDEVKIYDYKGKEVDDDVQAYIVHYPIVEMKLDLTEYMNDATKVNGNTSISYAIESNIGNSSPSQFDTLFPQGAYLTEKGPQKTEETPLFKISLANMTKLVQEVRGNAFGLKMKYSDNSFAQNVQIKIPAFGIDTYIPGTEADNKTLLFVNDTNDQTFIPKSVSNGGKLTEKNELEIFVKVTGPCSGTIIPEMVFDWTDAIIYAPQDKPIKGEYTIKNELGDFLGTGNTFEEVTGYVYMYGIERNTRISLGYNNIKLLNKNLLTPKDRPMFPITEEIPAHSLSQPNIELTDAFRSESTLIYEVTIETWEIKNDNDTREKIITADLVILLPLKFIISTPSSESDYVKLEMKNLFPEPGSGDLFMRTGKNNPDDLLNNLETVRINLERFQNTIINEFSLLIVSGRDFSERLDLSQDSKNPSLEIDWKKVPYPFSPRFEILIKKEFNQSYGILKIKHPPIDKHLTFDFFLTVEATANIDHKMHL